ncbi:MAG: precorrin-6y C5,15-methyltransferase (decarboxylating) subunit CbiE [Synergistaceae bacterium]|nr:precorrin-6y C5,15-methyltransferase (decarboxylating) subunit CbiE [Synergistaceae bacterium]
MGKITVVGVGPGSGAYLLPAAREAIEGADILAGGARHLAPYRGDGRELIPLEGKLDPFLDLLDEKRRRGNVALLLSGDPCFYSLLGKISARFSPEEYEVVPGLSSFQLLFARLGLPWSDAVLASLHGRPLEDAACHLSEGRATLFFLDGHNTGPRVASYLKGLGLPDRRVVLAENLGYDDERITRTTLFALAEGGEEGSLALLLLEAGPLPRSATGALPDGWFTRRGGVPLSKEPCRAMAASLLHPLEGRNILEVGSGSGGITAELARRAGRGRVYSVESSPEALAVAEENVRRAGVSHSVTFTRGTAPEALASLPPCSRAVVGGHGGRAEAVISAVWEKLLPGGRILVTANMPSTADCAWRTLRSLGAAPEVLHLAASSSAPAGDSWMLKGANPVFIIFADKDGQAIEG